MESKEEVSSDDGSFELVNVDEYDSMDLSDGSSYDLLCSEVSETLVLTEEDMKSLSESAEHDLEFKSDNDSDNSEVETRSYATDEGDMEFDSGSNSDSKEKPNVGRVNKGKKRNFMDMLYESTDFDLYEFPAQIRLKDDIREVAKNHIIRYLPAKSLFKFRKVSKEWSKWITSPFFVHMQSRYSRKTAGFFQNSKTSIRFISLENSAYGVPSPSLNFLPVCVTIKDSCNGLLLCKSVNDYDYNRLFVCNPANRQWFELPVSGFYHGENPKFVLAFEPSSLDFEPSYQVIILFSIDYPDAGAVVHFHIYDSKTKTWSEPNMMCPDLDAADVKSDGIFVNGVVYWETNGGELLACDFKEEIYSLQKLHFMDGGALSNVNGEVCYVRAEYNHVMKSCILDVYGDCGLSLKNTVYVPVDDVEDGEFVECNVLGNSCGDVVGLVVKPSQGQKRLYVYHARERRVEGLGAFNHSKKLLPYVNSLVSIEGA